MARKKRHCVRWGRAHGRRVCRRWSRAHARRRPRRQRLPRRTRVEFTRAGKAVRVLDRGRWRSWRGYAREHGFQVVNLRSILRRRRRRR